MNFTREPIIETVITPKEGNKLVVRSSKVQGAEEYFVDAVEIVSFGKANFFRSLEKPKCFLVPVSDYEVLETREARMVLKTPGGEKEIKIAGGRAAPLKVKEEGEGEERADKRRERRRSRKRRGKEEGEEETTEAAAPPPEEKKPPEPKPERPPSSIIPPPSTLISETITRYKQPAQGVPLLEEESPNDESNGGEEEIPF